MAVRISRANPFRFKLRGQDIDYITIYPRFDLMQFRNDYQRGIYSTSYYANYALNDTITIQVEATEVLQAIVRNVNTNATINVTKTFVTPVGWTGNDVINFSINTNMLGEGVFRFEITKIPEIDVYDSDEFVVADASIMKDLVKIQYYDSGNSFDGVFTNGVSWIWQPIRYFTGQIITGEGSSEYSIYNDDPNVPTKTKAEVNDGMLINFTDVSQYEKSIIDRMFGCDNIIVNGVLVQNIDPPEYSPFDKNDLCDISINTIITEEDNHYYKFS